MNEYTVVMLIVELGGREILESPLAAHPVHVELWSPGKRRRGAELLEDAIGHLVDPDDGSFLAPDDMPAAIDRFCVKTDQPCPTRASSYTRAILESLALKYRLVIRDLEKITGRRVEQVRVIGGGSKNRMLNQFTADAVGVRVLAGPAEATALGNIAVQILATGGVSSIAEARAIIDRSFPTEIFEPQDVEPWNREAGRFQHYCALTYA
jgi:sugar (pentulose or hexulose) kinase